MVPVRVESLVLGFIMSPSLVTLVPMEPDEQESSLPMTIGPAEAASIAAAVEPTIPAARPLTHELMNSLVECLGGKIRRGVIDRVEGSTFYASVYVQTSTGLFNKVDARPSDVIVLAIRDQIPLFVSDEVFEAASVPGSFKPGGDLKIEMEEFHKFIEGVSPEDFVNKKQS